MNTKFKALLTSAMLMPAMVLATPFAGAQTALPTDGGIVFDTTTTTTTTDSTMYSSAAENQNTNATTTTSPQTTGTAAQATSAQPLKDAKLEVTNMTQNMDATTAQNKAGDVIKVKATLGNLGPGNIVNYSPQIISEELFKLGTVIDSGAGGMLSLGKVMVYQGVTINEDCNCTETFEFSVKLNETMCTDYPSLISNGAMVLFEDQTKKLPLLCEQAPTPVTPTPVTPTPVTPTPVTPTPVPPTVSQTGPEAFMLLGAATLGGALSLLRRRKK